MKYDEIEHLLADVVSNTDIGTCPSCGEPLELAWSDDYDIYSADEYTVRPICFHCQLLFHPDGRVENLIGGFEANAELELWQAAHNVYTEEIENAIIDIETYLKQF